MSAMSSILRVANTGRHPATVAARATPESEPPRPDLLPETGVARTVAHTAAGNGFALLHDSAGVSALASRVQDRSRGRAVTAACDELARPDVVLAFLRSRPTAFSGGRPGRFRV